MNFGTILDSLTKTCVKRIYEGKEKESKSLAKSFINYIQLKEVLRKQFNIYNSINSAYIENKSSAKLFIIENLNKLSEYSFSDIQTYNALLETKFNVPKMKSTEVNKNVADLIKHKLSREGIDVERYVSAFNSLIEHVATEKKQTSIIEELDSSLANSELKFLTPKHVIQIGLKKFNTKYGSLFSEEDRRLFFLLKSGDKKKIQEYYDNMKKELNENFQKLSSQLDDELKEKIVQVLEKIKTNDSTESLLHGYELLSELKGLNNK